VIPFNLHVGFAQPLGPSIAPTDGYQQIAPAYVGATHLLAIQLEPQVASVAHTAVARPQGKMTWVGATEARC